MAVSALSLILKDKKKHDILYEIAKDAIDNNNLEEFKKAIDEGKFKIYNNKENMKRIDVFLYKAIRHGRYEIINYITNELKIDLKQTPSFLFAAYDRAGHDERIFLLLLEIYPPALISYTLCCSRQKDFFEVMGHDATRITLFQTIIMEKRWSLEICLKICDIPGLDASIFQNQDLIFYTIITFENNDLLRFEFIKKLLQRGCDPNEIKPSGRYPRLFERIHVLHRRSEETSDILGFKVSQRNNLTNDELHLLLTYGLDIGLLQGNISFNVCSTWYINYGLCFDETLCLMFEQASNFGIGKKHDNIFHVLLSAIHRGLTKTTIVLIQRGGGAHIPNSNGETPYHLLFRRARMYSPENFQLLIDVINNSCNDFSSTVSDD